MVAVSFRPDCDVSPSHEREASKLAIFIASAAGAVVDDETLFIQEELSVLVSANAPLLERTEHHPDPPKSTPNVPVIFIVPRVCVCAGMSSAVYYSFPPSAPAA